MHYVYHERIIGMVCLTFPFSAMAFFLRSSLLKEWMYAIVSASAWIRAVVVRYGVTPFLVIDAPFETSSILIRA